MCEKPYSKAELEQLIRDLLNITDLPFQIKRQIRDFIERGFTYKGIARALCYLIDVKNFNLRTSYQQYGIGIVKNVYTEAQNYFEKIKQEKDKQIQRQQQIISAAKNNTQVIQCGLGDRIKKIRKRSIDISKL